jgi:hypothetical protein
MKIHVFLVCYNESVLLPNTIKHYRSLLPSCSITIYDNESTDNSVEIAKSLGCNIISFNTNGEFDENYLTNLRNNCWKDISEGWVIVSDMDEWLYITESELLGELNAGTTIITTRGLNMIGESKMADISDIDLNEIQKCVDAVNHSKKSCFLRPAITHMDYTGGSHFCFPKGLVQYSLKAYINKHMNFLGLEYITTKYTNSFKRSEKMRKYGAGTHYTDNIEKIKGSYNEQLNKCYLLEDIPNRHWTYFKGLDSGGNDIKCVGRLPLVELIRAAETTPGCVAFNTLGYLKSSYDLKLNSTQWIQTLSDNGVYIKNANYESIDPSVLTVYSSPFPKLRLGKDYDGGYIIVDIPKVKYSILLAGGISDDISFEEMFLKKYKYTKCVGFDGTVNELPKQHPNIVFIKKNIGSEETDTLSNLHELIDENDNIFVKMDIEGGEVPWINSLNDEQVNRFAQIVIEFHDPFREKEICMFNKLNKNHILVHFHPNNCCGTRDHKGVIIPNVFECTYIHKKFFTCEPKLNSESIPSKLDMQNVLYRDEIYIDHSPFVHNSKYTNVPYRFIPKELLQSYTMNNKIPVLDMFLDGTKKNGIVWNNNYIDDYIRRFTPDNIKNNREGASSYGNDVCINLLFAFEKYKITNMKVAVVGSETPWIESILINLNNTVTTIEYNVPDAKYNNLECKDYFDFFKNSTDAFDAIVTFSSIEHSGLGRYGDPLDPDGDVKAMNTIHKNLKRGGILIWGAPVGKDALVWNAHRIYGELRLPIIFQGFNEVEWINSDKEDLFERPLNSQLYQPVVVLYKN